MGRQIIPEPRRDSEGRQLYSIFSSVVDDVIGYNATREEIVEFFVAEAAADMRERLGQTMDRIERGEPVSGRFTLDFDSMIETIEFQHGRKKARKVRKLILAPADDTPDDNDQD